MPAAYLKMKEAMIKQKESKGMKPEAAKKEGEKEAAMTWNKHHKGTGQTVGRGRN
jgi:hypothetical protein